MKLHAVLLALALLACKKAVPPRFCDRDLSGVWLNASDRHFAYRFRDHGNVLRGEYLDRQEDGGLEKPAEAISFELHRTQDTLAGVMRSSGPSPSGRICPLEFGIKVTDCQPEAMQAVVEMSIPIGDDCKRTAAEDGGEAAPALSEFRFERDRSYPSGGGDAATAR